MPYLIDTDWTIDLLRDEPAAVTLVRQLALDGVALSMVTYMEVWEGIERDRNPQEAQARFERFLLNVPVLPFSTEVAQRCARLRRELWTAGRRVNVWALDLINAATALHYGLTMATRNLSDYDDSPGLALYRLI